MPAPSAIHALSPRPARERWFWQAVLIFGPLLILAGLGAWGIRESRIAAKRHAIQALENTLPAMERLAREAAKNLREKQEPFYWQTESMPMPAKPGGGAILYERALTANSEEADRLLDEIELQHEDEATASGLPLLPLVKWARLQRATTASDRQRAAEALGVAAVRTHPSVLSAELLSRAEAFLSEHSENTVSVAKWRAIGAEHERALDVLHAVRPEPWGKWEGGWATHGGSDWFFWNNGNGSMRAASPQALRAAAAECSAQAQAMLPAYVVLDVCGQRGKSLLSSPPQGEHLIAGGAGDAPFTIAWVLVDPAAPFAEQRQQALWLAALLAAALLAATIGFFVLRRSLSRERQLSEMKSNFVSSVSHELRAPLASMRLMAENLEAGIVTEAPRRAEYHRLMADECRRLGALVDNVLDFARIEQGRKTYHFAETDLSALVADTLRLLAPVAERRGQKFACEIEPLAPYCDALAIQQALVNLLDNALKFSPAKSVVTVSVKTRGLREWTLAVRDEGPGVPPHEREKIFQRFYRVGSELTRETQGAGIGLSIVKHIAEGHGGQVEVEGSTFTLVLPMTTDNLKATTSTAGG